MGGGTLDLTLMSIVDGCIAGCVSAGDGRCGGQDIDHILMEYVHQTYFKFETSPNKEDMEDGALLYLCKNAKETLSQESEVTFEYKAETITITRKALEHLMLPVLHKIKKAVMSLMEEKNCILDEVVLVGGSSRMPVIRRFLRDLLKIDDNKELCTSITPEEAVAEGLAIRGAVLMGYDVGYLQSVLMMDTLPAPIGLLLNDGKEKKHGKENKDKTDSSVFYTVIEGGTKLPCVGALTFAIDVEAIKQKFVTLSIYEDISKERDEDIVDLKLLANDDFLLPIDDCFEPTVPQKVTVEFKVSSEGKLQVKLHMGEKVSEDSDSCKSHSDENDGMRMWVLYLFLAVTVLLYLFIKLQLQTALVNSDNENLEAGL